MKFEIPEAVEYVIKNLEQAGYEAYLVGGCVRDFLMGKEPKDYDVTTVARPEEIHEVFDSPKVIDTGIKHGTVTIIKDHTPVEVTTYRTESTYSDGRHPDEVKFSRSIEEDLARRDFTMNAIAYSPFGSDKDDVLGSGAVCDVDDSLKSNGGGRFVDPFGGIVDIEEKRIKCVGNPGDRFSEDALRIMRALRFSSQLGFEIEKGTAEALIEEKAALDRISRERIQKELEGILCGDNVEEVLREYSEIIACVIPEIVPMIGLDQCNPYHIYDVWEHSIRVVSGVPAKPELRLAALFHDIGKPSSFTKGKDGVGHFYGHPEVSYEMAERIMRRLRFDNETRNKVLPLVRWHDLRPEPTDKSVRKALVRVGPELFDGWIAIKRADNWAQSPVVAERQALIDEVEKIGHRLMESEGVISAKTLAISGKDLMELGISEGPEIGRTLDWLLKEVLEERMPNEKEALLNFLTKGTVPYIIDG